jgi:hypothetical protein
MGVGDRLDSPLLPEFSIELAGIFADLPVDGVS